MEFVYRFVIGGLIVSLFALIGDIMRPRSFAGLFGAAPSVALATLALTIVADGKWYAATEARSMVIGAVALCLYAFVVIRLLIKWKLHAAPATVCAIPVWLIFSIGTWLLLLR